MRDLEERGARVLHLDVTDTAEVNKVVDRLIAEQGRTDVLVNNAGFGQYGVVEAVSEEQLKYRFDVNVFGMQRRSGGSSPNPNGRMASGPKKGEFHNG